MTQLISQEGGGEINIKDENGPKKRDRTPKMNVQQVN